MLAGNDDEAEKHFTSALETDLTQWPMARGRLLLANGAWLRRPHQPVQAREPLRVGRQLFDHLGIPGWGANTRIELKATGAANAASGEQAADIEHADPAGMAFLALRRLPAVRQLYARRLQLTAGPCRASRPATGARRERT